MTAPAEHAPRPSEPGRVSDPLRVEPRSVRFRAEREAEWNELEELLDRVLPRGLRALSEEELHRLPMLYRSAVSSLNVARKTALDRALVAYLEALVGRAYLAVYTSRRPERAPLFRFVADRFPRAVRSMAGELGLVTGIFALGVFVAYLLVRVDSEWYFAFVAEGLAGDRTPGASTESLRHALYGGQEESLSVFASFLFTHNAGIGLLAFALGFAAGVPTAFLVFTNGTMLGAFIALYDERGLLWPLLGWLLPHGVPEIGAILLCGAGGLALGRAVVSPGSRTVRDALTDAGRRGAVVVAGSVLLFLVAGFIEGFFRQLVTIDVLRFGLALFNAAWLGAWLLLGGRQPSRSAAERRT
jgi:uncharacterized membrane protein SpoIIM required for sporulation